MSIRPAVLSRPNFNKALLLLAMRYLIDFCQFFISLLYTALWGLGALTGLAVIVFVIGYPLLQLVYLVGFLYKLYTYQL